MEKPITGHIKPGGETLDLSEYEKAGGYQGLRKALKSMSPPEIIQMVKDSNLKGRGGAGFPTGMKWSFIPKGEDALRPIYLAVNADEMEPGTFKDRLILEGNPHLMIEGAIISAFAIQADVVYIFLRWAYKRAAQVLKKAVAEAYQAGFLGQNILGSGFNLEMHLHISSGRYICGEETGLLNALEGKRAIPRSKPPFPVTVGLWGKDTVVNNVETLSNIPHLIDRGTEWFLSLSHTKEGGTKIYGVSGKVKHPGAWELPMGTTVREILDDYAGGMQDGLTLKGFLPGGASTDFLTQDHLDVLMDFDSVSKVGSRMGTGTMIVLDDQTCPVGMVANLERFFAMESCGWCTPCREGLPWTAKMLYALEEGKGTRADLDQLARIPRLLSPGHTFCALAPGAVEPLQSALKFFKEDFERHLDSKGCPWRK